jgi:hypothetical protein
MMVALGAFGMCGDVWAYDAPKGGSGASDICTKVKFSEFTPPHNSEVPAKSAFSFFATEATHPKTFKVTVKGLSVPVTVTPKPQGYLVSGKLPDSVKGTFARINITAKGLNQCDASDGWLIKIGN